MSNPGKSNPAPIENVAQLVALLEEGVRPKAQWRIGMEHEKFGFRLPEASGRRRSFSPPPYAPRGIGALLEKLSGPEWEPIRDLSGDHPVIGLLGRGSKAGKSVSLEPGGQLELSGAPLESLHETARELEDHFDHVRKPAQELGYGFAPLGFQPLWKLDRLPMMPKGRYGIMWEYMPKVGTTGREMMKQTCTVQVNLDFDSEADMARKMRVSLALQPLVSILFANSPFRDGKVNGLPGNRAQVLLDIDKQRTDLPEEFYRSGFTFERYVDWVLDVPMYFVVRNGRYLNAAGLSFRRWLNGRGEGALEGLTPTIGDFEDHLTTVFPDVRLKRYLEMRGADATCPELMLALPAFWAGLLYDAPTLLAAERLVDGVSFEAWMRLRREGPRLGFQTPFVAGGVGQFAMRLLELAEHGLKARSLGEEKYLLPLRRIVEEQKTRAGYWLERFHAVWGGQVQPVFLEAAV